MNSESCPTCGRPWPDRRGRICSLCELPIKQYDRWHFVGARVQHRDCQDPTLALVPQPTTTQTQLMPE